MLTITLNNTLPVQENYFFELSKYSKAVQEHCAEPGAVLPERAKNEVLAWIEDGCRRDFTHSPVSASSVLDHTCRPVFFSSEKQAC